MHTEVQHVINTHCRTRSGLHVKGVTISRTWAATHSNAVSWAAPLGVSLAVTLTVTRSVPYVHEKALHYFIVALNPSSHLQHSFRKSCPTSCTPSGDTGPFGCLFDPWSFSFAPSVVSLRGWVLPMPSLRWGASDDCYRPHSQYVSGSVHVHHVNTIDLSPLSSAILFVCCPVVGEVRAGTVCRTQGFLLVPFQQRTARMDSESLRFF